MKLESLRTVELLELYTRPEVMMEDAIDELSRDDLAILVLQLLQVVRHQEDRFACITEIGSALGSTFDLDELLTIVMSKVTELMSAERSTLFILDPENDELWSKVTQGVVNTEIRLKVGDGIAGWVALTGKSINIRDAYSDPRFNPEVDSKTGYHTRSILCQPMRNQEGRIIGVVQVLNKRTGHFTDEDENLLSALASQAAVAVENSKLYLSVVETNMELTDLTKKLEKKIDELDTLDRIESELTTHVALDNMISKVTQTTAELFDAQAAVLALVEDDEHQFFIQSKLDDGYKFSTLSVPTDVGVCGQVIASKTPFLCNTGECEGVPGAASVELGIVVEKVIAVPLFDQDERAIGALKIVNRDRGFDGADLKLLGLIASRLAGAVVARRIYEEMQKSERLASIGQMLSGVIHDLKNPIAIINGYVQLMAKSDDKDKRDKFAKTIYKQFDLLNQMTQELLNYARGEKNLLAREVYLNNFFDELSETLNKELATRNVELALDLQYANVIKLDVVKMQRAILNLARNAADAMPNGGIFTIRTELDEANEQVLMTFSDTGCGIPDVIQGTLFDEFVTEGKSHGTGLGLSIVKKIVELHGGSISFETGPSGTTFLIALPLDPHET